jgi:putative CocE/NonD family hydrolase
VQKLGEVDFGPSAAADPKEKIVRWLDHYVQARANDAEADPPVDFFLMGANEWRTAATWPSVGVPPLTYYLHSQGSANSSGGDGLLAILAGTNEPADQYTYDPGNPVPTVGGATCCDPKLLAWGPMDQHTIETRQDVLVFSSAALASPVSAIGAVEMHLYASSSARDTDWSARLTDVSPDGRSVKITDGVLRARFRNSFSREELLRPGETYEFVVPLAPTAHVFAAGHRIRLDLTSSDFPRYTRNTNTGNVPELDDHWVPAQQRVFHDARRPSRIIFNLGGDGRGR